MHRRNVRAEATAVLSVVVLVTLTILVGAGFDPLADVDGAVARRRLLGARLAVLTCALAARLSAVLVRRARRR